MIPEHATIFKDMNLSRRPLSRLSYQIMGLNLIAVAILVMGIFYLDTYRENLTATETELLATETELYSTIIGNAVDNGTLDHSFYIADAFAKQKNQRLRLFNRNGALAHDTYNQNSQYAAIHNSNLETPPPILSYLYNFFKNLTAINFDLPLYQDENAKNINNFKNAAAIKSNNLNVSAWQNESGALILSSSSSIKYKNKIMGHLIITRSDTNIARTFESMRSDVFILFIVSFIITLVFSLYLSANIGHPLRFLASAAEKSRDHRSKIIIPDLSYRKDEIGDLSLSLRDMTSALIERMNSIEQFAADVAHELKNPLTSLKSAFETLERVQDPVGRDTLKNIIQHDFVRMDRLITNISNASRLDAELAREDSAPVDLNQLLTKICDQYRQQNYNINFMPPLESFTVWGTIPHLSQVFQNIFDNGFSFGTKIDVVIVDKDETISVHCRDNGTGIPAGKQDMIFKRFYTDRPETETYGTHTGLGLSIALQIMQSHGGTITVDSDYINGAEFIVQLRKVNMA